MITSDPFTPIDSGPGVRAGLWAKSEMTFRCLTISICALAVNVSCLAGQNVDSRPKLVKLVAIDLDREDQTAHLVCDGKDVAQSEERAFISELLNKLQPGDCVVVTFDPERSAKWFDRQIAILYRQCHERRIALRFISSNEYSKSNGDELYIVWWKAPYDNPRGHDDTLYFLNHDFAGKGDAGFCRLMKIIRDSKPTTMGIVGSEYTDKGAFSSDEIPYRSREREFYELLKRMKVKVVQLSRVPLRAKKNSKQANERGSNEKGSELLNNPFDSVNPLK